MSKVLKFEQRGWLTAEEMAERDGISLRTVYRRLKRGELESRDTPEGVRYRKSSGDITPGSTDSLLTAGDTDAVTDSTDSTTDTTAKPSQRAVHPSTDTPDVSAAIAEMLVERLENACAERGRVKRELEEALEIAVRALDERDALIAELKQWQAFALQAVEEVEWLRHEQANVSCLVQLRST